MQIFEELQAKPYVDELVTHIEGFSPIQSRSMGKEGVRTTVSMGLREARGYGFTLQGPARFYVEMMFLFGSSFATDPQYRRITQGLRGKDGTDELARADRVHARVMEYLDAASGPGHEFERRSLSRALQVEYEKSLAFAGRPASDLVNAFHRLYPEKVQALGSDAIAVLVEKAYSDAAGRGSSWVRGGPLFAAIMFTFGHGCFTDPQYPWIARSLENAEPADAIVALERLFQKFRIFLGEARSRLETG
jgi:hypothetical protein